MARKTVLITGCSSGGIGSALAQAFQAHDFHVFAGARSPSKMADLSALPHSTLLPLDVSSPSSIASALDAVRAHTGGTLDVLINNSGTGYFIPSLDADLDTAKRMFDVNVWGALAMTQAFAPLLIASRGTVVNVGSVAGEIYPVWEGVYAASKAALATISETLRLELAPFHVAVLTVVAGEVKTNFFANASPYRLPDASFYKPIESHVAAHARGEGLPAQSSPDAFAQLVLRDVLARRRGKSFRGATAGWIAFVRGWAPGWWVDRMLYGGNGLEELEKREK
ncbi:hypothetical protein MMC13_003310 [Lambiella insularis]|nr:hypothetical protein [Lambiella insularis]